MDITGVTEGEWRFKVSAYSLFFIMEKCIPSIIRDPRDRFPVNRDGVTNAEFRKHLIRLAGYVARRLRRRKPEGCKGVKNSVLWSNRRWVDCDDPADLLHLNTRITELLVAFPKLGGNLDPENIARIIATTAVPNASNLPSAGPAFEDEEYDSDSSIDDEIEDKKEIDQHMHDSPDYSSGEASHSRATTSLSTAASLHSILRSNRSVLCTARRTSSLSLSAPLTSRCYVRLPPDDPGGTATGWGAAGRGGLQLHGLETCPAGLRAWAAFAFIVHHELGIKVCAAISRLPTKLVPKLFECRNYLNVSDERSLKGKK